MITRTITRGTSGCAGYREAVARVPGEHDVRSLKVGDLAPDCFGGMTRVTRISHVGTDVNFKYFCCYVTALDDKDTPENGCGCSNSMKEGRLVRTTALTGMLNSAECDELEALMAPKTTVVEVGTSTALTAAEHNQFPRGRWS